MMRRFEPNGRSEEETTISENPEVVVLLPLTRKRRVPASDGPELRNVSGNGPAARGFVPEHEVPRVSSLAPPKSSARQGQRLETEK